MKLILLPALLLSLVTVNAQTAGRNIIIGKVDSINSHILNEKRDIWVYVPNSDPASIYGQQKYPVVYLLDGDAHFYSVMGLIQQLSEVNGNTICPEMIVVGIPNTDRSRDLTPTPAPGTSGSGNNFGIITGGGENFTSFIEKELIPHIDSLYPTAPYRMFIGHSLGGLMVVNALINHTNLFNSYVAIDPSLWWDNQNLLKQATQALGERKFTGRSLYLGIANTMDAGMDTSAVKKDTSGTTLHIRSILQFANELKRNPRNNLHWSYKYYNDDSHGSVPLIAEYDAIRFIFNNFKLPAFPKMFDESFNADSAIALHFKKVSKEMGYKVLPPEPYINQLGYTFLQRKMTEKSYNFFRMNLENYPQSFNVYDSMGDYYDVEGKKNKAIEYYSKALTIKEVPDIRKKLESVKNGK